MWTARNAGAMATVLRSRLVDRGGRGRGNKRFTNEPQIPGHTVELIFTIPEDDERRIVRLFYRHLRPSRTVKFGTRTQYPIIMVHGVPTSSDQYKEQQLLFYPYLETYALDISGMGKSTRVRLYDPRRAKYRKDEGDWERMEEDWDFQYTWVHDCYIIAAFMRDVLGLRVDPVRTAQKKATLPVILLGDDWGGGIVLTFSTIFTNPYATIAQNPTFTLGWPVAEVETIGRLAQDFFALRERRRAGQIMGEKVYQEVKLLIYQRLWEQWQVIPLQFVQMLKSMVFHSDVFDAFRLRRVRAPYEAVNYGEEESGGGSTATLQRTYGPSMVLYDSVEKFEADVHFMAFFMLAIRAAWLDPRQMLDIDYANTYSPNLLLWGVNDNMMPPEQAWRLKSLLTNASVRVTLVDDAGHFANLDQPGVVADAILDFITQQPKGMQALYARYQGELRSITYQMMKNFTVDIGDASSSSSSSSHRDRHADETTVQGQDTSTAVASSRARYPEHAVITY